MESLVIGAQPVEAENMPFEGSLETSHLLEQVRFRDCDRIISRYLFKSDRCLPWNCTFPQNGKFVPQGSRSTSRN